MLEQFFERRSGDRTRVRVRVRVRVGGSGGLRVRVGFEVRVRPHFKRLSSVQVRVRSELGYSWG